MYFGAQGNSSAALKAKREKIPAQKCNKDDEQRDIAQSWGGNLCPAMDWPCQSFGLVLFLLKPVTALYFRYAFFWINCMKRGAYSKQVCIKKSWEEDNTEQLQQLASICAKPVSRKIICNVQSGTVMKSFPTQLASGLNSFCYSTTTFHPWCFPFMLFGLHEKFETKLRHKLSDEAKHFPLKLSTIK